MRYWWVNQNQTFRQEVGGGYLWSPQRKKNGERNAFYETMREVAPGDLIFSFCDTKIRAIGIARSYCYECPRPLEFGQLGMQWDQVGWRLDVSFREEPLPIRPADHMPVLAPMLPERYAPLRPNGAGLQSVYLTELPKPFAEALGTLMGRPILDLVRGQLVQSPEPSEQGSFGSTPIASIVWERELTRRIETDAAIADTEKTQLILARRGQGTFRKNVRAREWHCRVTHVDREEHLRASHCKPWRDSTNEERLDGENGLLLTPSIDHLFDRGFITFEGTGRLVVSDVADQRSLQRMGVATGEVMNVGPFTEGQRRFLDFHREHVFLARNAR